MASIHKDPRGKSPFFYCAFTLPNGKRCFKSTKLKDRNAATEFCLRMEGAARKAVARNFSEEQARKILNEIRELSGDSAIRFRSLADYATEWLHSKQVTSSEATFIRYSGVVKDFLKHAGKQRSAANVEALTAQDVKAFRDYHVKEGKAQTTANLALKTLRSMFNDARREGLIATNPAEAIKTFDVEKEARDVFTHDQLCAVIAKATPEWRTAILLAYYSGLRLSDAVSLSWENVNFELRQIRYFPRKANRGLSRRPDWKKHVNGQLEVPLMPELEAHLLSLSSSDDPAAKLCPTLATKGTGGNRGLSSMFQRVMAAAGIHSDRGVEKKGKGRQFKTLGFHSLRHTFVSELANADVPADVRRQISGHNDEKIHERYTHLNVDTKRRALAHLRPLAG
ncbi:MAG: tyrosine-type recombinase/integrase [Chthoniobacterales bacterium]